MRCGDGTLYTGIATDVQRRFLEHQHGVIGSRYLRGRAPLVLVFEQTVGNRSQASKVEYFVRKLPKADKEDVTNLSGRIAAMLEGINTE